jgi:hypothetical protein
VDKTPNASKTLIVHSVVKSSQSEMNILMSSVLNYLKGATTLSMFGISRPY